MVQIGSSTIQDYINKGLSNWADVDVLQLALTVFTIVSFSDVYNTKFK